MLSEAVTIAGRGEHLVSASGDIKCTKDGEFVGRIH